MTDQQSIKDAQCFACKVLLEAAPEPDCQTRWACPICGVGESRENILAECGDYAKEQAARYVQELARKLYGSGGMYQLTLNPIPERSYRFFMDIESLLPGHDETVGDPPG